jgi:hypothetical protein
VLADVYSTIAHYVKRELLNNRLWPVHKYMTNEVLDIIKVRSTRRPPPAWTADALTDRLGLIETDCVTMEDAYSNVAKHFDITVPYIIDCLLRKRTRNKNTHFDKHINNYAQDQSLPADIRSQFANFVKSTYLRTVFSENDYNGIQRVYLDYCDSVAIPYWER